MPVAARQHPHVGDEPAAAAQRAAGARPADPSGFAPPRCRSTADRTSRRPTPTRCRPCRRARSAFGGYERHGVVPCVGFSAGSTRKFAMLRSRRSPHGYRLDSAPPRAAFSHSASVGRRNAFPVDGRQPRAVRRRVVVADERDGVVGPVAAAGGHPPRRTGAPTWRNARSRSSAARPSRPAAARRWPGSDGPFPGEAGIFGVGDGLDAEEEVVHVDAVDADVRPLRRPRNP